MKSGTKNVLIIGGAAVAGLFIMSKMKGETAQDTLQNIFPSAGGGDGGIGDFLGGLLGGMGIGQQQGEASGFMDGLFSGLFAGGGLFGGDGGVSGLGNLDLSGLLGGGDTGLLGGGDTGLLGDGGLSNIDWSTLLGGGGGGGDNQYSNTIPNILNALSNSVDSLGKGLLYGGGTYLGLKALSPLANPLGNLLATGVKGLTPGVGSIFSGLSKGISYGVTGFGNLLTTPVASLGVTGTLSALPLVGLAAAGGYGLGTLIEPYTTHAAGDIGEFTARNLQDVPVIGGTVSDWLGFSHAEVKTDKVQAATSKGVQVPGLQNLLDQGYDIKTATKMYYNN